MEPQNNQPSYPAPAPEEPTSTPLPTPPSEPEIVSTPDPIPEITSEPEPTPVETYEPVPDPTPSPLPEPVVVVPEPTPVKKSGGKGLKVFLIVLLALIAVAGIGYSAYAWNQNKSLQSDVTSRDAQIASLNSQVSTLKTAETTPVAVTATVGNVINIRELGLSITVPDSIKDISYRYTSSKDGIQTASFSTKAITDKYANTGSCTSASTAPPLGELEKFPGQYKAGNSTVALLKQFPTYYIAYSGPQSACVDVQDNVDAQLKALKDSLSTVKEL